MESFLNALTTQYLFLPREKITFCISFVKYWIFSMLGIPHESLVGLCESHFSAIPAGNAAANEKPNYTGGKLLNTAQFLIFPVNTAQMLPRKRS